MLLTYCQAKCNTINYTSINVMPEYSVTDNVHKIYIVPQYYTYSSLCISKACHLRDWHFSYVALEITIKDDLISLPWYMSPTPMPSSQCPFLTIPCPLALKMARIVYQGLTSIVFTVIHWDSEQSVKFLDFALGSAYSHEPNRYIPHP